MTHKIKTAALGTLLLLLTPGLRAQLPVEASDAELAIPFGAATGQIATAGDLLLFINSERKDASFAVPRANISNVTVTDSVVTVETNSPINGSSTLSFRILSGEAARFSRWAQTAGGASMEAGSKAAADVRGSAAPASQIQQTYRARHNHTFGSCTGQLIVRDDRVSYDSVDEIGHSRQWQLQEVKEFKRKNPYKIVIEPFVGDKYDLQLVGEGMSSGDYQEIARGITSRRRP